MLLRLGIDRGMARQKYPADLAVASSVVFADIDLDDAMGNRHLVQQHTLLEPRWRQGYGAQFTQVCCHVTSEDIDQGRAIVAVVGINEHGQACDDRVGCNVQADPVLPTATIRLPDGVTTPVGEVLFRPLVGRYLNPLPRTSPNVPPLLPDFGCASSPQNTTKKQTTKNIEKKHFLCRTSSLFLF